MLLLHPSQMFPDVPSVQLGSIGNSSVRFLESAGQVIATIYQSHLVNLVNDVLLALHLDADFSLVGREEEEEAPVGPIGKQ